MVIEYFEILILTVLANDAVMVIVALNYYKSTEARVGSIWILSLVDALTSTALATIWFYYTNPSDLLSLISLIVFSVIIAFVISLEVPGYLIISHFDNLEAAQLNNLRSKLIRLPYSFSEFGSFEDIVRKGSNTLSNSGLDQLMKDFIQSCGRTKNVNPKLWDLLLSEVTKAIDHSTIRSKHPFPKLIDVLSLTGLSFLIAQLLRLIGGF